MNDPDGLDLLAAVRNVTDRLPFILFTGKGSEEIAAEAISRGLDDYMQKGTVPDQFDVLVSRIRSYVQKARAEQALEDSEAPVARWSSRTSPGSTSSSTASSLT